MHVAFYTFKKATAKQNTAKQRGGNENRQADKKSAGARKMSEDAGVGHGGAARTSGSRDSDASHYDREMMERGEEALREWDYGVSDGA